MIEKYKDLENGVPNTLNVTDVTHATNPSMTGYENKTLYWSIDIAHQLETEVGKSHGSSMGALKVTSGNGPKD